MSYFAEILWFFFFFFNDTATTEIYTLSLHDALPIYRGRLLTSRDAVTWTERRFSGPVLNAVSYGNGMFAAAGDQTIWVSDNGMQWRRSLRGDRKSTRLNSSH